MLPYEELLKKYNIALQTIDSLRAENKHLKSKLGIVEANASATTTNDRSAINKYSSVDTKIRLFRKLFSGREDVFARRWYSKTTGKSGYQPVCENEWVEGICDKKAYKCSVCPNRKLLPLSDRAVYNHLAGKDEYGRDVIGIYPMLPDDTCRFLCADFDDAEFEKDVAAYRSVCEGLNLSVSVERSRSGNGAHAWLFFEEAVPADLARKMGTIILTKAMQLRKEQAEKRPFEHYLIPRFTSFRSAADKTITTLYKELSENQLRNNLIANDVIEALSDGRTPIILTERREHIETLSGLLSGKCDNIITLFGTSSQKEKRETLAKLESIPDNEKLIIIATGKYVGEGFDYPRLDTLFLALPIAWKGKVAQYTGRLHRNYTGKTEVQVYDYVDIHVPMLEKMYQKRVKGYAAVGYKAKIKTNEPITPNLIYDGKSFYPVFADDVMHATKEILIVSPFMRKNRLTQTIKLLSQVILNGVSVTVVTRPPEDFKEKERDTVIQNAELLLGHGIQVKYKSEFHQKFTVIDQKVAWYGSVNFLSYGTHEESIMRFESYDLAGQLIDTVI